MIKTAIFELIKSYSAQIKGFAFLWLGVFILGATSSYNALDPSLNKASDLEPSNIFGHSGAFVADPILQIIGLAYILPAVIFLVLAARCLFKQNPTKLILRITFSVVATIFLCSTISNIEANEQWLFYTGIGGFVGDAISRNINELITIYGNISLSMIIVLSTSYFAMGIQKAEIIYIYNKIKNIFLYISKRCVSLFVFLLNIARLFQKKELIETPDKTKRSKHKAAEQPDNIVEYNTSNPPKKRKAEQASLNLEGNLFNCPPLKLLTENTQSGKSVNQRALEQNAKLLKNVLEDFGIYGEILKVRPGPVVTLYELEPSPGTKSSRVISLADDIARSMSSISARISTIPGRNILGIELPNSDRETVYLRELIETEEYRDERIKLPFALGKDIGGEIVMADLAKMPHLLIAGTTGSGKSVAVNAMILSYLYRLSPDECKFIMIDPKMLELSVYDGIPHLLTPVVTEPKKAVVALNWAVREMEERYRLMSHLGVRNIMGYNKKVEEAIKKGSVLERTVQTGFHPETGEPIFENQAIEMKKLPFIVVIVDEMADLMLTAGKEIEASIQRLAQMARAAGIHMVMATQRPSVDVITGIIKANFPTRISFQVTSRIDSRTILGEMGAEQLLGMGDMLYMAGGGRVTRVHGPFVGDKEVEEIVNHLKSQGEPSYIEDVTDESAASAAGMGGMGSMGSSGEGDIYDQAVAIVIRDKKASTSYVQRQLKIGYNRAANLIEKMEREGVISKANHAGKREVLVGQD